MEQLLKVKDVQLILGCSKSWAHALIRSGKLRSIRLGRSIRVPASALTDLMCHGTNFNVKTATKQ